MHLNKLPIDIIRHASSFLQRTDQIALKLTIKSFSKQLEASMDLNKELELYTKTIDQLDYAWKGDTRYIKIINHKDQYSILHKFAIITNLWYFDFNAQFDINYPDKYVIMFLTSLSDYTINLEFTNLEGGITKSSHNLNKNKIIVDFQTKGKLKVNCREIDSYKNFQTVQYIMCIPLYYWNKLGYWGKSQFGKYIAPWKKQFVILNSDLSPRLSQIASRYFT